MNNDLLNILSNSNKDIDNQRLMDYLAGKLNDRENHEIERTMAENEFMKDAMEGLSQVKTGKPLENLVEQLNRDLHAKLEEKKLRKKKRQLKEQPITYIAIVLVIALVVIAYFVIHRLQQAK